MSLERAYQGLLTRRLELALAVLEHPPADWPEFQRRYGRWLELNELINLLEDELKGIEDGK